MDSIDKLLANMGLSKDRISDVSKSRQETKLAPRSSDGNERMGARGHLTIMGISPDKVWTIHSEDNTVTDKGFEILARVWSNQFGGNTYNDNYRVGRIAIGNGAHPSSIETQVALHTPVAPPVISGGSYNALTSALVGTAGCKFEWIVDTDEANGLSAFTEAGLFPLDVEGSATGAGGMIAYKTYPSITKTASFALLFSWEFTFTVAP